MLEISKYSSRKNKTKFVSWYRTNKNTQPPVERGLFNSILPDIERGTASFLDSHVNFAGNRRQITKTLFYHQQLWGQHEIRRDNLLVGDLPTWNSTCLRSINFTSSYEPIMKIKVILTMPKYEQIFSLSGFPYRTWEIGNIFVCTLKHTKTRRGRPQL